MHRSWVWNIENYSDQFPPVGHLRLGNPKHGLNITGLRIISHLPRLEGNTVASLSHINQNMSHVMVLFVSNREFQAVVFVGKGMFKCPPSLAQSARTVLVGCGTCGEHKRSGCNRSCFLAIKLEPTKTWHRRCVIWGFFFCCSYFVVLLVYSQEVGNEIVTVIQSRPYQCPPFTFRVFWRLWSEWILFFWGWEGGKI